MLRIALAQMRVIPGHPSRNTETMLRMITKAKQQDADLVVFPEMAISGYLLGDTWEQTSFLEDCEECGREIPLLHNYYEVAYMVCYCKSCYDKKYGKQNKERKNDNETIKCSLFDDITECNFNHPCDDCSRLIKHEEL